MLRILRMSPAPNHYYESTISLANLTRLMIPDRLTRLKRITTRPFVIPITSPCDPTHIPPKPFAFLGVPHFSRPVSPCLRGEAHPYSPFTTSIHESTDSSPHSPRL